MTDCNAAMQLVKLPYDTVPNISEEKLTDLCERSNFFVKSVGRRNAHDSLGGRRGSPAVSWHASAPIEPMRTARIGLHMREYRVQSILAAIGHPAAVQAQPIML